MDNGAASNEMFQLLQPTHNESVKNNDKIEYKTLKKLIHSIMSYNYVINPVYLIHGTHDVQLRSILDSNILDLLKMVFPDWLKIDFAIKLNSIEHVIKSSRNACAVNGLSSTMSETEQLQAEDSKRQHNHSLIHQPPGWSDTGPISSVRTTLETMPQEESELDCRAYSIDESQIIVQSNQELQVATEERIVQSHPTSVWSNPDGSLNVKRSIWNGKKISLFPSYDYVLTTDASESGTCATLKKGN
ncbi:hypothetical protein ACTFIR_003779 [Dictyostelium discoideum]